jgi:uncharacterized protein (TIGR02646 family)
MRPIVRGDKPVDSSGNTKTFKEYQEARGELIARLGQYCSYCEMKLDANLAVEHVQPKSLYSILELDWGNFLLACTNCNSTKNDQDVELNNYYWPDLDNNFIVFIYLQGGLVHANPNLNDQEKNKAKATLKLTGLDKISTRDLKFSDRRQFNRAETWDIAIRSLNNLHKNNTLEMREQIALTAMAKGYWSVWMTVFKDDADMLNRFIQAFPGTCQDCFDCQGKPIPRPHGDL